MAQSYLNTGTQIGNREDLINYIFKVSYALAPFMNAIGTTNAKAIKHEWMTQALRAGTDNAAAEGFTPSFAAGNQTVRVRRSNQVQIMKQEYSVSLTQEYVDKAGLGTASEFDNQADLKELEVMKDADFELLRSTTVTRDGDAGTAGEMDGALAWAQSTIAAAGGNLSQDLFEDLSRQIYELSGEAVDLIVVAGKQRRKISTWTTNFKQVDHKDTDFTDTVETYRGDYGVQTVLHDLHMVNSSLLACKKDYLKKAYLRPLQHYEIGQTIDARRGYVVMEVTLEARNPNTVGSITGLSI